MGEEPLNVGLAPRLGLWLPGAAPGQGWEQGWEGSLALPTTLLPCVYYQCLGYVLLDGDLSCDQSYVNTVPTTSFLPLLAALPSTAC